MKAVLNDQVIAEADKDELIFIEGHWYFPPGSVKKELLAKSQTPYHCPWKGDCQYFNVKVGGKECKDCAFGYPNALESAVKTVGKDFRDHLAFWQGVEVKE